MYSIFNFYTSHINDILIRLFLSEKTPDGLDEVTLNEQTEESPVNELEDMIEDKNTQ